MKTLSAIILFLLPLITLCAQNFTEVSSSAGISISYGDGDQGGGVSFADFNGDGSDDLTFTSGSGLPLYFYQNNGDGTFTSLTIVSNTEETKEAIWVDYDNDGDQDLFFTVFNGENRLYQNDGSLNMTDVTQQAFGSLGSNKNFGAAWGDYDNDGWLDLYVCRYVAGVNDLNRLYRNNGDGTFTDVHAGSPCNDGVKLSFDACFFDRDNDTWQEIYVANDRPFFDNGLYINQFGTYAQDPGGTANVAIDAMNAGGADYDNDGDLDLYVSNTEGGNMLLRNDGNGNFTDVAPATGTAVYQVTWASNFFDYDNDLDQDLYVSSLKTFGQNWANAFLINEGDGTFSNPLVNTGGLGGTDTENSYGHAMGDINNDGKLDIAVSNEVTGNMIWRNDEAAVGNYFKVRLSGTVSNRDGIGARVVATVGNQTLTRYRHGSQGYLSQHSQTLHFGIGANNSVSQLTVYWPSGIVDTYTNLFSINQVNYLTEGETVLPLILARFQARDRGSANRLWWMTEREIGTSHFEIERSTNGEQFELLGRVDAAGNSNMPLDYEYLDEMMPSLRSYYYRLKMVDQDGSFTYSPVKSVMRQSVPKKFSSLKVNPTIDGEITLQIEPNSPSGTYILQLYRYDGQLQYETSLKVNTGTSTLYTLATGIPSGSYLLEIGQYDYKLHESHRVIVR